MQRCPLCDRNNRMVVKGVYLRDGKRELYPDMGYSFCNCKDIFYTRKENIIEPVKQEPSLISQPDPFFCQWDLDPYDFHWDIRKWEILWDMHSLVEELKRTGHEVIDYWRDFDVASKTPRHFHIRIKI